jgi:hypothetical protein
LVKTQSFCRISLDGNRHDSAREKTDPADRGTGERHKKHGILSFGPPLSQQVPKRRRRQQLHHAGMYRCGAESIKMDHHLVEREAMYMTEREELAVAPLSKAIGIDDGFLSDLCVGIGKDTFTCFPSHWRGTGWRKQTWRVELVFEWRYGDHYRVRGLRLAKRDATRPKKKIRPPPHIPLSGIFFHFTRPPAASYASNGIVLILLHYLFDPASVQLRFVCKNERIEGRDGGRNRKPRNDDDEHDTQTHEEEEDYDRTVWYSNRFHRRRNQHQGRCRGKTKIRLRTIGCRNARRGWSVTSE